MMQNCAVCGMAQTVRLGIFDRLFIRTYLLEATNAYIGITPQRVGGKKLVPIRCLKPRQVFFFDNNAKIVFLALK